MNENLSIKTTEKVLRIRNFLQQISHISFTFANINKRYPLEDLTEKEGQEVLQVYDNLLEETGVILSVYKSSLNTNKNGKSTA